MKTPLTRQRLRNHIAYSWWKYALLIVIAWGGWNLIYDMTRPRPPEEKKVILNVYVNAYEAGLNDYLADVNATQMPEMEEISANYNLLDPMYGDMVFYAHVVANDGDVYLINRDYFQRYASSGVYRPLDDEAELLAALEEAGVSLTQGWRTLNDTGERHLYAIPCAGLPGIAGYVADPSDCYLAVLVNNGNDENVLRFLNIFVSDMLQPIEITEESY